MQTRVRTISRGDSPPSRFDSRPAPSFSGAGAALGIVGPMPRGTERISTRPAGSGRRSSAAISRAAPGSGPAGDSSHGPGVDSQADWACKEIIRRVHAESLSTGAQLMRQEPLRRSLGVGTTTINLAIQRLVECGFLRREHRVGTFVRDPGAIPPRLWTVGVAVYVPARADARETIHGGGFFADLAQRLHAGLAAARCNVASYTTPGPIDDDNAAVSRCPALMADLADGALDAVLTTSFVSKRELAMREFTRVPVVHAGFAENMPASVAIDQGALAASAVPLLHARGCRRIAMVCNGETEPSERFFGAYMKALGELGQSQKDAQTYTMGLGLAAGRAVAAELLALPTSRRPDGLIIGDDWIALAIAAVLAGTPGYRPRLVVQTNRQIPLAYALPVIRYEVDIAQIADLAVNKTLAKLRNPASEDAITWIAPRLSEQGHEAQMPALALA